MVRFVAIAALAASVYNPSELDLVALLRSDTIELWPKLLVLVGYAAAFLVLGRQAWCGFDPFGRAVPLVLALGFGALLWEYWAPVWAFFGPGLVVLVISAVLTLGQVSAYYIRQVSGQQLVLRDPP